MFYSNQVLGFIYKSVVTYLGSRYVTQNIWCKGKTETEQKGKKLKYIRIMKKVSGLKIFIFKIALNFICTFYSFNI